MTYFDVHEPPDGGAAGFRTVAGPGQGLSRLLLAVGRLPMDDVGPVHLHFGEEVLHVVRGRLLVRIGDERRECGPGDVVSVPAGAWHGFRVLAETEIQVIAEQRIGTVYPVADDAGRVDLVEVFRPDMPWGRPPPDGRDWTSDPELRHILDRNIAEV
jgi:quercetin dioxygenase-like cupin family protein